MPNNDSAAMHLSVALEGIGARYDWNSDSVVIGWRSNVLHEDWYRFEDGDLIRTSFRDEVVTRVVSMSDIITASIQYEIRLDYREGRIPHGVTTLAELNLYVDIEDCAGFNNPYSLLSPENLGGERGPINRVYAAVDKWLREGGLSNSNPHAG